MFCYQCGTKIPENGRFCPGCGTPIVESSEELSETPEPAVEAEIAPEPEIEVTPNLEPIAPSEPAVDEVEPAVIPEPEIAPEPEIEVVPEPEPPVFVEPIIEPEPPILTEPTFEPVPPVPTEPAFEQPTFTVEPLVPAEPTLVEAILEESIPEPEQPVFEPVTPVFEQPTFEPVPPVPTEPIFERPTFIPEPFAPAQPTAEYTPVSAEWAPPPPPSGAQEMPGSYTDPGSDGFAHYPPPNVAAGVPMEAPVSAAPRKSKKPLFIILGAVLLVIIIAVVAVIAFNSYRSGIYEDGLAALNAENYQEAYDTFAELGDYRDASTQMAQAQKGLDYEAACALLDAGDLEGALMAFNALGSYKDSSERAEFCQQTLEYEAAIEAFDAGDYESALDAFNDLSFVGFSDSSEWVDKSAYAIAEKIYEEGKLYEAYQAFKALGSYADSADRAQACTVPLPNTGELYHNGSYVSSSSAIVIDGSNSTYVSYYKVYAGAELVSTIFLNPGGSCTVEVPPGDYTIKEAVGSIWFGEEIMFGDEGGYEVLLFEGDNNYFTLEYNIKVTITLAVLNGDVGAEPTSREDF
jgi:TolA-binding protein